MALAVRRFPLVLATVGLVAIVSGTGTAAHAASTEAAADDLSSSNAVGEPASFIVSFAPGASPLGRLVAARVVGADPTTGRADVVVFASGAGFAAPLDATTAAALRARPDIAAVTPNRVLAPAATHLDRIGAPAAWRAGLRGDGQTIAVLDTGVDATNPNLAGVVRAEACFTTPRAGGGGDCPNGSTAQIGVGAAVPCTGRPDCSHGTHVASVAAGIGPGAVGVAPGAGLVAVQVFSSVRAVDERVLTDEASLVRALEWLEGVQAAQPIAAVNLSLGGAPVPTPCAASPALTAVIGRLTAAGVAVVASAGNDASASRLSFPACVPGVLAVAAEGAAGTAASFSNVAAKALLYAPGEAIEGAWADPCCTRVVSGTSFAAPQVAAAFALLRQQLGPGDVATRAELLRRTGEPVRDTGAASYEGAAAIRLARATDPQYQTTGPARFARPAAPTGALDVVATEPGAVRVAGWALDPDHAGPVTVHVYVDGAFAATTVAERSRPDVGAVFPGYGAPHGFDVRVSPTPGDHVVCAYALDLGTGASNVLLGCAAVSYGVAIGSVDALVVAAGTVEVSGWALDNAQAGPVEVELVVDDEVVARRTADATRPDVGAAYPGYGAAHGYAFAAPLAAGSHRICVRVARPAGGARATALVGCRDVVAATGAPVGTVDVVVATADALIVGGWAIDPDTRRSIRVRIEADDGAASPEVAADLVRVDLEVGAPGYGTAHGYRVGFAAPGARRVCAAGLDPEQGTWSIVACADVVASVSAA